MQALLRDGSRLSRTPHKPSLGQRSTGLRRDGVGPGRAGQEGATLTCLVGGWRLHRRPPLLALCPRVTTCVLEVAGSVLPLCVLLRLCPRL